MKNKRLLELLKDIDGQTKDMKYRMIEAYVNNEVQQIAFKEKRKRTGVERSERTI